MFARGARYRTSVLIRVVLLGVLLVATFVFHIGGPTQVELRVVRIAIVAAIAIGGGWLAKNRGNRGSGSGYGFRGLRRRAERDEDEPDSTDS